MDRSEETHEVYDFASCMPIWGGEPRAYYVMWRAPSFFWKYWQHIWQLAKLHRVVRERAELILRSADLPSFIDWVRIDFRADGMVIDVPGDACGIHPASTGVSSIGNHNVDSMVQAMALHLFFSVTLEEAYRLMAVIEYNPEAFKQEERVGRGSYTLKRTVESRQFELYEIYGWSGVRPEAFVWARTWEEAGRAAGDNCSRTARYSGDKPLLLSRQRRYVFEVELGAPLSVTRRFEVIAGDEDQAEELLREELQQCPMLAEVVGVRCLGKEGETILPQVRDL